MKHTDNSGPCETQVIWLEDKIPFSFTLVKFVLPSMPIFTIQVDKLPEVIGVRTSPIFDLGSSSIGFEHFVGKEGTQNCGLPSD